MSCYWEVRNAKILNRWYDFPTLKSTGSWKMSWFYWKQNARLRVKVGSVYEIELNTITSGNHIRTIFLLKPGSFCYQEWRFESSAHNTMQNIQQENQKIKMLDTAWHGCIIRLHFHLFIKCKSFHMGLLSPRSYTLHV